jgi:hypothetical protein
MTHWLLIAVICSDLACMALPPERLGSAKDCQDRGWEIGRQYMKVGMIVKSVTCKPPFGKPRVKPTKV